MPPSTGMSDFLFVLISFHFFSFSNKCGSAEILRFNAKFLITGYYFTIRIVYRERPVRCCEHQIVRTHQLISSLILYSKRFYYGLISYAFDECKLTLLTSRTSFAKQTCLKYTHAYLYFSCDVYSSHGYWTIICHMICTQSIVLNTHNGINHHLEIRRFSIENNAK